MPRQSTLNAWMSSTPGKRPPSPDSDCQIVETSAGVPKKRRLSLKRTSTRLSCDRPPKEKEERSPRPPPDPPQVVEMWELPISESTSSQATVASSTEPEDGTAQDKSQPPVEFATPYYLENFQKILDMVLSDDYHRALFTPEELRWRDEFDALPDSSKKLFIRLYGRKNRWLRRGQIKYDKIDADLDPALRRLVDDSFLVSDVSGEELPALLDLLPAPELGVLGKEYKLRQGARRQEVVDGLVARAARKSLSAFVCGAKSVKDGLLKRVRSLLGTCYRLDAAHRSFFNRVLLLHSLTSAVLDEEEAGQFGQKELFEMLRVTIGLVKYPAYETCRQAKIFCGRDDLVQLERLQLFESNIASEMERKEFEAAYRICEEFEEEFIKSEKFDQFCSHGTSLPTFLRSVTPGGKAVAIVGLAVEVAEKARRYDRAERHLRWLLDQEVFHACSRGRWWDRLTLDLERHLRRPAAALEAARRAMQDPHVVGGHRLAIHLRGQRLSSAGKGKGPEWPPWPLREVDHVTIDGRLLPGERPVWIREGGDSGTLLCGVEQLALHHYRDLGFPRGVHGESGTLWTLCVLLLWDVMFVSGAAVPDAFLGPHQAGPFDLYDAAFYRRRRGPMDARLAWLEAASDEELGAEVRRVWESHGEEQCAGFNRDLFLSADDAVDCLLCIGGRLIAGLFRRLCGVEEAAPVGGGRHWRSGLPDLLVWSPAERRYRFVEVKGPTDRLSTKQQLWLDAMLRLGVNAEVCHVRAVGAKRLSTGDEEIASKASG